MLYSIFLALLAAPTSVLLERFGAECHTELSDDSEFAKCDEFCADDAGRCGFCRCRACAMCAALPADGSAAVAALVPIPEPAAVAARVVTAAMVAAAVVPTPPPTECSGPTEAMCEDFCSPFKGQHCGSCRCAKCAWCAALEQHDMAGGPPTTMRMVGDNCDWVQGMKMRDLDQHEYCSGISEHGRGQCEVHVTKWRLGEALRHAAAH